jgi:tRNA(Arg) A34 adenosine deaminase TadA
MELRISLPEWVDTEVDWSKRYATPEDRMALAVDLSRENARHNTGGPFGAAVFEAESGVLVAVGVNGVTRLNNSAAHAEMLALMLAEARVGSYTLDAEGLPDHDLYTSCEPCAMCLGAAPWSGVRKVVMAALREDAESLGFDEGPVFPESYTYLEARGLTFERGVLRPEAVQVLRRYTETGGEIYNA